MRRSTVALAAAFIAAAVAARAQTGTAAPSSAELAMGCAPPPTFESAPQHAVRIAGAQDTSPRTVFGDRDLLVLDGGTKAGVQIGQRFFVRRANASGMYTSGRRPGVRTLGWVRIVAANESTALAQVEHACGAMITADYLEPYAAPVAPAVTDTGAAGEPDFQAPGHVVGGNEGRSTYAGGDFALIDRGSSQGVAPGQRFAIFRDMKTAGLPLASVGEAVVVSTSASLAVAQITRARDAVFEGDYVVPRK